MALSKEKCLELIVACLPKENEVDDSMREYISEVIVEATQERAPGSPLTEFAEELLESAGPFLEGMMEEEDAEKFFNELAKRIDSLAGGAPVEDAKEPETETPILHLPDFILAFGGRVLLTGTELRMVRGHRYALYGHNGVGKTTLMTRMGRGDIEGFPAHLRCVYVKHEVAASEEGETVRAHTAAAAAETGAPAEAVEEALASVGFSAEAMAGPVAELSGGWRMRLALARAALSPMDVLLLDEPTNHLDVHAVAWLVSYLNSLKDTAVLVVSHDAGFLDKVATDIIWMHDLQLSYFNVRFSAFLEEQRKMVIAKQATTAPKMRVSAKDQFAELRGEVKRGAPATGEDVPAGEDQGPPHVRGFKFPSPAFLDGVTSMTRSVVKLKNVSFTYPGATTPSLKDVSCRLTLGSRVAMVGKNGAGKSTLLKLIVDENEPSAGDISKHHNLIIASIAQHSMHHLDQHQDATPIDYIRWRFKVGNDEEALGRDTVKLTEEEEKARRAPKALSDVLSRRKKYGGLEYEVRRNGVADPFWMPMETVLKSGSYMAKLIKAYDEACNAAASGISTRVRTYETIRDHLADFGLPEEYLENKIKLLSGGQRSRLVLAAALWQRPHLICLDEPTNYLDRDALDSLSAGLRSYKGAVLVVSHNQEFMEGLANEWWYVRHGELSVSKDPPVIEE